MPHLLLLLLPSSLLLAELLIEVVGRPCVINTQTYPLVISDANSAAIIFLFLFFYSVSQKIPPEFF